MMKVAELGTIRRRSLQVLSPARELWTRPAVIAASLMISQPLASHAAGTVNQTSALSLWMIKNLSRGNYISLTQVRNSSDIFGDLVFCVFPETAQEIDDQVDGPFSMLEKVRGNSERKLYRKAYRDGRKTWIDGGFIAKSLRFQE